MSGIWNVCQADLRIWVYIRTKQPQASRRSAAEDLDNLKLRHVSTELSTKGREVIRVKSLKSASFEESPRSPITPRSPERSFDRSARSEQSESSFGIDASVPMDREDSMVVCNVDDLLPPIAPEACRDGEMVLYWSQSLQQCASAVIVGKGTFCSGLVKKSAIDVKYDSDMK